MAEGIVSYSDLMSPNSWMQDHDIERCYEILNLKTLRAISSLPDE